MIHLHCSRWSNAGGQKTCLTITRAVYDHFTWQPPKLSSNVANGVVNKGPV